MKSSPLLFNNEGSMLSYFRAMVSDPDKRSATISSLIDSSERNYTTDCEFPNQIDVSNFKSFIDDLADGLHKGGLGQVGLTVGGFAQSKLCVPGYEKLCSNGTLSYDDCNCCAFVTWFDPTMICSQTQNESDTAALFSLIRSLPVRDIAVWVNIWQDDRTKMLWQSELQSSLMPRFTIQ
eukprot:gene32893-42572_t